MKQMIQNSGTPSRGACRDRRGEERFQSPTLFETRLAEGLPCANEFVWAVRRDNRRMTGALKLQSTTLWSVEFPPANYSPEHTPK